MTRLTDRHKTIPYFKSVLVSSDTWGRSSCAGLEVYGTDALLRSVTVTPALRNTGLGRALVGIAERDAVAIGVQRLFLLTTSAADYFSRIGYQLCDRSVAPLAVQTTSQFSGLCPSTAVCMSKELLTTQ
ncbi:GNAT family N-acetyltransferase [Ralstonia pseudosolanacearum]|nr:GNAT family N-acetyltransferase [Ralstonia pseudosolanacearum]